MLKTNSSLLSTIGLMFQKLFPYCVHFSFNLDIYISVLKNFKLEIKNLSKFEKNENNKKNRKTLIKDIRIFLKLAVEIKVIVVLF